MCDGDWNRLKKIQEKKKKIKAKAEIEAKLRRAAREAEEEGGGGEGEDVLSTEKPVCIALHIDCTGPKNIFDADEDDDLLFK